MRHSHTRTLAVAALLLGLGATPAIADNFSPDLQLAQVQLHRLGIYPGAADGLMGPNTAAALRSFQLSQGLHPSGQLDATTQNRLGTTQTSWVGHYRWASTGYYAVQPYVYRAPAQVVYTAPVIYTDGAIPYAYVGGRWCNASVCY